MEDNSKFLDIQLERLTKFKNGETSKVLLKEDKIEPQTLNDATKDLANQKEIEEKIPKIETIDKNIDDKYPEVKVEPTLKRVDLDKNAKEEKNEVDAETKSHLDWLNDKEEADTEKGEPAKGGQPRNYEEEINGYKTKVFEYEGILNDDYVKAIVEFRKNGGTDLSELNKHLGIVDTKNLSIEDFYKQRGKEVGLEGEALEDAVLESMEKYKQLGAIEQKEVLNSYKNNLTKQTEEKLKSFSSQSQSYRQEQEKVQKNAFDEIQKEVNEKVGKKWRGLLIDAKMGKVIQEIAPLYAPEIKDQNGRVTGYDVKKGVRMAILDKFEKQLYKTQYDLAHISAYDKAIQERNRPSENMMNNQVIATDQNDIVKVTKELRDEAKKKTNLFRK